MLKKHLAACLVTSALAAVPAFAQTSPTAPTRMQAGSDHFLTQEQPGQWRGSKLVGLNVYGPENEKVGDINEIIVDQAGKLSAVVIGVGGFLGIGEKDVAVPFAQLKFMNEPRRTTTTTDRTTAANPNAPAGTVANPVPPAGTATTRTDMATAREYPDHAVIDLTRDQLKAAPSFAYASRGGTVASRTDAGARTTGTVATPTARDTRRTDQTRNTSEVQAIQNMKVSLGQALDTAEQQGRGKAIDAEFERSGNAGYYAIKVLSNDNSKLTEYKIDGNSGQVTGSDDEPVEKFFTRLKPADLQNARTSLKQALATAEKQAGGKAIDAEVEREGSGVQYKITVANGDRTQDVRIDGNGQVVSK
jgi:uncharacterized membrane protein YkoI